MARTGGAGQGVAWSGLVGSGEARLGTAGQGETGQGKAGFINVKFWETTMEEAITNLREDQVSNGAEESISFSEPYSVSVTIVGTSDLLFHRWNDQAVAEKAKAAKNSKAKKTDTVENYVYRTEVGELAIPGEYLRQAIIGAAKYRQDPRSPRKSAMDLYKAGVVSLKILAGLGKKTWDYEDRRRVVVQRNGITRVRPAMLSGWRATFELMILTPEYIDFPTLLDTITAAGRLIGLADFRPTFGRFQVVKYGLISE
jgi:hypothetical protein